MDGDLAPLDRIAELAAAKMTLVMAKAKLESVKTGITTFRAS